MYRSTKRFMFFFRIYLSCSYICVKVTPLFFLSKVNIL